LIERLGAAEQITQLRREVRKKLSKFIRKLIAFCFDGFVVFLPPRCPFLHFDLGKSLPQVTQKRAQSVSSICNSDRSNGCKPSRAGPYVSG
jgi:hypothetical protein